MAELSDDMKLKLADCEGQDRAKARPPIFEEELGRRLATNMHATRDEERRISANVAKTGVVRRRKKADV